MRYQVQNVDRAVAFCTENLGFQLTQRSGPVIATITRGDLHLLLSGPDSSGSKPMPGGLRQESGGWNRIVLYVDAIDDAIASLKATKACAEQVGTSGLSLTVNLVHLGVHNGNQLPVSWSSP